MKKALSLDDKIALCEDYTQLWARFFNFFGDGFEGRKITGEAEADFFRVMTDLARKYFRVVYFLGEDLKGSDQIPAILNAAISLSNIQTMSETQFSKFQHDWHIIFIALNKCLGRLMEKRPVKKGQPAAGAKAAA